VLHALPTSSSLTWCWVLRVYAFTSNIRSGLGRRDATPREGRNVTWTEHYVLRCLWPWKRKKVRQASDLHCALISDRLVWRGKDHNFVKRFPGSARLSFWKKQCESEDAMTVAVALDRGHAVLIFWSSGVWRRVSLVKTDVSVLSVL
jgi:hypothetical protein